MAAFIIGNGPSRANINLEALRPYGEIWGCNALYRDFIPNYLVAVDKPMQDEIVKAEAHLHSKCIFRQTSKGRYPYSVYPTIHTFQSRKGIPNNSGLFAVYFALKQGSRDIYLIGFDFQNPTNQTVENVYKGTKNYTSNPRYRGQVEHTFASWFTLNSKEVNFYRVMDPKLSYKSTEGGLNEPHTINLTMEQFGEQYNSVS